MDSTKNLNSPDRFWEIREVIENKPSLKQLYVESYNKFASCMDRSPREGLVVELGTGAGFSKSIIPEMVTTDVINYPGIDKVLDATKMDFADNSLSCICMFNVLHHIPDTPAFFHEAIRCLKPNGRICMIEPYPGFIAAPIYRYFHHEPYDTKVKSWKFESKGPLTDANNALPYIIFQRDKLEFEKNFPNLLIESFKPHTPLRYWLTGGLQKWSLLPKWAFSMATWLDESLIKISSKLGSFVDIEIVKI